MVHRTKVPVLGQGYGPVIPAVRVIGLRTQVRLSAPDRYEAAVVGEWKRTEQYAVSHTVDRRRGADAQPRRKERRGGKRPPAGKRPHSKPHVLHDRVQQPEPGHAPDLFL